VPTSSDAPAPFFAAEASKANAPSLGKPCSVSRREVTGPNCPSSATRSTPAPAVAHQARGKLEPSARGALEESAALEVFDELPSVVLLDEVFASERTAATARASTPWATSMSGRPSR
jgi:hypothetical protein